MDWFLKLGIKPLKKDHERNHTGNGVDGGERQDPVKYDLQNWIDMEQ